MDVFDFIEAWYNFTTLLSKLIQRVSILDRFRPALAEKGVSFAEGNVNHLAKVFYIASFREVLYVSLVSVIREGLR